MNTKFNARTGLLLCTALASTCFATSAAYAQAADESTGGLEEIVVTAQKREQSLQDVPVAVTAISQASLETNRIVSVADLNGIAPNVTVRPGEAKGIGLAVPATTAR